jgi:hypothetical protein
MPTVNQFINQGGGNNTKQNSNLPEEFHVFKQNFKRCWCVGDGLFMPDGSVGNA